MTCGQIAKRGSNWKSSLLLGSSLGLLGCAEEGQTLFLPDASMATGMATADGGAKPDGGADAGFGSVAADGLTIAFGSGRVKGKLVDTTREFLGIPYAKAPVGALRFAAPQAIDPWTGDKDATMFGASCAQSMGTLSPMGATSEDCLSINVFAPQSAPPTGLPVYVFIHGGAFISGGSSQYDGQKLSERGPLVVVTLNYRLGPFGFLSHAALDPTRGAEPSGNDGIRDQQLALKWVKNNIAAFGGDPTKVTVAGESAGSMSACIHFVSPPARELAQRFVFESGVCTGETLLKKKADGDALGKMLSDELCAGQPDPIQCLRAKPIMDLTEWHKMSSLFGAGFVPVYNAMDPLLPDNPAKMIDAGNYNNKAPILAGTNLHEWGLFQALGAAKPATGAELETAIDMQLGAQLGAAGATAVKAHYKPASDAEANDTMIRLMTDSAFRCPTRAMARQVTKKGTKVFLYSFEQGQAFHAYEIPYVFGNMNALLAPMIDDGTLMTMQPFFMQFATTGDPNGRGALVWPAYDEVGDQNMSLKTQSAAGTGLAKADCDFWVGLAAMAPMM
jgi:para-nitrobenzyl esterase